MKLACSLFGIEVPENIILSFDFENKVSIVKNKKTQQVMIVYGSSHDEKDSISFGK